MQGGEHQIIKLLPKEDLSIFHQVPLAVYSEEVLSKYAIHQLEEKYLHCVYVLLENQVPKARLALYFNPLLRFKGKKAACVGAFECVENYDFAKHILKIAANEAASNGFEFLIGPMSSSTWNDHRFSSDPTHPFLGEPYHQEYYRAYFEQSGFHVIGKYISSIDSDPSFSKFELKEAKMHFEAKGIQFRNIDLSEYDTELELIYHFCLEAFQENFLFTPIDKADFVHKYKKLKPLLNEDLVQLALKEGKIVALALGYIDPYQLNGKAVVLKTLARLKDPLLAGIGKVLGLSVIGKGKELGYENVIHALMHSDNFSTQLSHGNSGKPWRNYSLYGQELEA